MIRRTRCSLATAAVTLALVCTACDEASSNTVRAVVQLRPGGLFEELEMEVREVPVDPRRSPRARSIWTMTS